MRPTLKKLYTVSQPRVRTVVYERILWADSPEAAIIEAEDGTAWPHGVIHKGQPVPHPKRRRT